MRFLRPFVAALAAVIMLAWPASARILIAIDKSAQHMTVSQDGEQLYVWPVSTGHRALASRSASWASRAMFARRPESQSSSARTIASRH